MQKQSEQTISITDINSLGEDGCGAAKFVGDLAKQSELEFEPWKIIGAATTQCCWYFQSFSHLWDAQLPILV